MNKYIYISKKQVFTKNCEQICENNISFSLLKVFCCLDVTVSLQLMSIDLPSVVQQAVVKNF